MPHMHVFTYTTPTFITEVFHLVVQVQLILTNVTMNLCYMQHWLTLINLVSMMHVNAMALPINDTDYNCLIKAVKLV